MPPINRRGVLIGAGIAAGAAALNAPTTRAHARGGRPLIGKAVRPPRIHLMTYNIRYDTGRTTPGQDDHWPEREPLLVDLLRTERPALLGIQEGLFHQLRAIERALPDHRTIGYGRAGGSRGEYSAIYYAGDRFDLLEWDQFWLSDTPLLIGSADWGNRVTRIVVWARFTDRRTGTEFVMINTHFDHQSEPARVRSAATIDALVRNQFADLPVLVTGDFNVPALDSEAYRILVSDGRLADTWTAADERLTEEWNTFNGYRAPVAEGTRIDWVLASPGVRVHTAAINPYRPGGRFPSDHFPVQAVVELPR
ncbi:endonuclease/exonuclease/phosphatase family protein [Naumannella huperziae]